MRNAIGLSQRSRYFVGITVLTLFAFINESCTVGHAVAIKDVETGRDGGAGEILYCRYASTTETLAAPWWAVFEVTEIHSPQVLGKWLGWSKVVGQKPDVKGTQSSPEPVLDLARADPSLDASEKVVLGDEVVVPLDQFQEIRVASAKGANTAGTIILLSILVLGGLTAIALQGLANSMNQPWHFGSGSMP